MDKEKIIKGLECCIGTNDCEIEPKEDCPYNGQCLCAMALLLDIHALLKEQEEERSRLVTWLAKFNRHIDNGYKWLPDDENLDFYKKKMHQQFGWDTDGIELD